MKTILFVHHEPAVRADIRNALAPHQHRFALSVASSAEDALALCAAQPFDVVLAEMWMPGTDGVTLLARVLDRQPTAARLLIAHHSEAASERAANAASVAYATLRKPCRPADLIAAISRVTTLQDLFYTPALRHTIGRVGKLPSLSSTYRQLNQAVRDPDSTIASVARILEQDMAMAAKILQLVNSGFFGLPRHMANLQTAVSFLGLETIKNIALATETFTLFRPAASVPHGFLETLQRRANRAAALTAPLPLTVRERDIAIIGALLHDLGQLILASTMPQELRAALDLASELRCPLFEAEEQHLGISHAELGAYLLGLWGIGQPIVEAVAHHHRPNRIPHHGLDASSAVYLAALAAEQTELHPDDHTGQHLTEHDRANLEALNLQSAYDNLRETATASIAA